MHARVMAKLTRVGGTYFDNVVEQSDDTLISFFCELRSKTRHIYTESVKQVRAT